MREKITIIDYGMGNIHSIDKALRYVSCESEIQVSGRAEDIASADRVVFPGVGAIGDCMKGMRTNGLDDALALAVKEKPVLAICVGMQALYGLNEEDDGTRGMGLIQGEVKRLQTTDSSLKVPHMGWNSIHYVPSPLWEGIAQDSRFYFVHSYYCVTQDRASVCASCEYGLKFDAAVLSDNLLALQFHPEKSHTDGLQLLKNFMNWRCT